MFSKTINPLLVCACLSAPAWAQVQADLFNPTPLDWTLVARTDVPEATRREGKWNGELDFAETLRLAEGGELKVPALTRVQLEWKALPDAGLRIPFALLDAGRSNPRESELVFTWDPEGQVLQIGLEHRLESKEAAARPVGMGGIHGFTFLKEAYGSTGEKLPGPLTPARIPTGGAKDAAGEPLGAGASPGTPATVSYAFRPDSPGTPTQPSTGESNTPLPSGPSQGPLALLSQGWDAGPRTPSQDSSLLDTPAGTPEIGGFHRPDWVCSLTNDSDSRSLFLEPADAADRTTFVIKSASGTYLTNHFSDRRMFATVPPKGTIHWMLPERPEHPQTYWAAQDGNGAEAAGAPGKPHIFLYGLNFRPPENHRPLPLDLGMPSVGMPLGEFLAESGPGFQIERPTLRRGILYDTPSAPGPVLDWTAPAPQLPDLPADADRMPELLSLEASGS
jgi:hypothetical protein